MISLAPSGGIHNRCHGDRTFSVRFLAPNLRDLEHKVRDLAHMLEILCLHNMKPVEHGTGLSGVNRGPPLGTVEYKEDDGNPQQFLSRSCRFRGRLKSLRVRRSGGARGARISPITSLGDTVPIPAP